jgi:hypothetical protein
MKRTSFLTGIAFVALTAPALAAKQQATVYRDRGCGCCGGWAAAMQAAGYDVSIVDIDRAERLARFKIPAALASCHTAVVGAYLIEGHVPMAAVAQLMRAKPKTRGIALPGMPTGTPGMPGPKVAVAVVLLDDPQHVFYTE